MIQIPDAPWIRNPEPYHDAYYYQDTYDGYDEDDEYAECDKWDEKHWDGGGD